MKNYRCSIQDCELVTFARGWCQKHYMRNRKYGDPLCPVKERGSINFGKTCWAFGCSDMAVSSGLCSRHKNAANRHDGDPNVRIRNRDPIYGDDSERPVCSIENCSKHAIARGLCNKHYLEMRRHGKAGRDKKSGKWFDPAGYVYVFANGNKIHEHRHLAEIQLGRKLVTGENVHHRNTIRSDNSIGPCLERRGCDCGDGQFHNLELWNKPQPTGGRVADLLQHAIWVIKNSQIPKEDLIKFSKEISAKYGEIK